MADGIYTGNPLFGLEIGVENPYENNSRFAEKTSYGPYADHIDRQREIFDSYYNAASPLSIGNPMPRGIGVSPTKEREFNFWDFFLRSGDPEVKKHLDENPDASMVLGSKTWPRGEKILPPEVEGIGVSPVTFVADQGLPQEPPLRGTAVHAIAAGSNIAEDQRSDEASREAVASLLAPESGGYSPLTGLDRLFAIMSGMGRRGGMSPLSDFLQSNVDLRSNEAAAMKNYQDRMIEERDLAERRADRDERRRLEERRVGLSEEEAARRRLESQYIGRTTTDQKNVTAQILNYIQAGKLSEYADELDSTWFGRQGGKGLSNREIAEGLTLSVIEIFNRAKDNNTPITIEQAIEQAATEPGDESSGSANGIRSDSPVKINPAAPIESE